MPRFREGLARLAVRVLAITALTVAVTEIDLLLLPGIDAAFFYFLPIIAACVWFGYCGMLAVPVMLTLYHRNTQLDLPPGASYPYGSDGGQLLSFSLVAGLTLVSEWRYRLVREVQRQQETLRAAAEARGKRLESLYRVASAANTSRGPDEFLPLFLEEVRRTLPHVCIATVLEREGDILVRRAAIGPGATEAAGERIPLHSGAAGQVALTGRPLVLQGREFALSALASDWVRAARPSAVLAIPLVMKGEVRGVVAVFGEAGAEFSEEDVRTLESMASEAALVLESLHLYESLRGTNAALQERQALLDQQLSLAREVQTAILSVCPDWCAIGPMEMASCHESAWEVGGDLLRIVPHEDGTAAFIGDVMGKGVPAALLMTMMTAELSSPSAPASDPAAVLAAANRVLIDNIATLEATGFITACYVYVASGRLSYASAGHPPAILVRADGASELLTARSLPLGIYRQTDYTSAEWALLPGDRLVLYTDGVTEARNVAGEFYGTERLRGLIGLHHALPAAGLRDAIVTDLRAFMGERPLSDDIAMLVIGVTG